MKKEVKEYSPGNVKTNMLLHQIKQAWVLGDDESLDDIIHDDPDNEDVSLEELSESPYTRDALRLLAEAVTDAQNEKEQVAQSLFKEKQPPPVTAKDVPVASSEMKWSVKSFFKNPLGVSSVVLVLLICTTVVLHWPDNSPIPIPMNPTTSIGNTPEWNYMRETPAPMELSADNQIIFQCNFDKTKTITTKIQMIENERSIIKEQSISKGKNYVISPVFNIGDNEYLLITIEKREL